MRTCMAIKMVSMKSAAGENVIKTKIRKIGNSMGVIIPSGELDTRDLSVDDEVKITVEKLEADHDLFMEALDYSMKRFSKAYRELAK